MNHWFRRLVVGVFVVLSGIVPVEMAYAAKPVNACQAIKGKTYVYFFERPFAPDTGGHYAGGGRIAFNDSMEQNGSVSGSARTVFAYKRPFEAQNVEGCGPNANGTATCEHGAQQILIATCVSSPDGQGSVAFTSTGGDAGHWRFWTSDGGKTLWTEASHGGGSRWVFQELDRQKGAVAKLPPPGYLQANPQVETQE